MLTLFGTLKHPFPVFQPDQTTGEALGLADLLDVVLTAVTYGAGLLLFVLLIYGGFSYMIAGGDEKAVTKAKAIMTNAGIGLVIVVCAWFVVAILQTVLGFTGILQLRFTGPGGGA